MTKPAYFQFFKRVVAWAVAAVPAMTLLVFVVYGFLVRVEIGHWPVIYRDSVPDSLRSLDQLASVTLLGFFWSVLFALVAAALLLFRVVRSQYWRPVLAYWLGVVVFLAACWIGPIGGFVDWFLD